MRADKAFFMHGVAILNALFLYNCFLIYTEQLMYKNFRKSETCECYLYHYTLFLPRCEWRKMAKTNC